MIGLDTNVLVRYAVQDDPGQSAAATAIIEGLDEDHQGFVSLVVIVELHWVLRRAYRVPADRAAGVIRMLLDSVEITVQHSDVVRRALDGQRAAGIDFADALIARLGQAAGCDQTLTFDAKAAGLAGMELIPT